MLKHSLPRHLENNPHFSSHFSEMNALFHKVMGEEVTTEEDLLKKLPLIKYTLSQDEPKTLHLYFLCHESKMETPLLWREMVSTFVHAKIFSTRSFNFKLKDSSEKLLYFEELLLLIDNEKELELAIKNLNSLIDEIKVGILSKKHLRYQIGMNRMPYDDQTKAIFEKVIAAIRHYPRAFSDDLILEAEHFLIHFRGEYRKLHEGDALFRVICSLYLFYQALEQASAAYPDKRHLYARVVKNSLQYPFGKKRVLGIAIGLNTLQEYECFDSRHILKAVSRFIEDVRIIPQSYYADNDWENHLRTLYVEIEKISGEDFSNPELFLLKRHLRDELKNNIEYLSPSLFAPRNEEELFRNILHLSHELKYVDDLPQAVISFQEQKGETLRFNVILLRILGQRSLSIQAASQFLPPSDRLSIEKIAHVGRVRKKYIKEATLFSLEIPSKNFLRKNHSVDLLHARGYIVSTIEKMVGPFRDYNGGFLLKKNEQLTALKAELGEKAKVHELAIEALFYSLSPAVMQTILTLESTTLLFTLFLKLLEPSHDMTENFLFLEQVEPESYACGIKIESEEMKERLFAVIAELSFDSLKLASASIEKEGYEYCCFLLLNPDEEEKERLRHSLLEALSLWSKRRMDLQIVRLSLPRPPPSLDPRMCSDRTSGTVIKMLYEGLMRFSSDGKLVNGLAKEMIVSRDQRQYLFRLRKSFWSNNTPVTANDFEYAWKKILDPSFKAYYSFLFFVIKNAKEAKEGLCHPNKIGLWALDDYTLLVELEEPFAHFPQLLAHWIFSPLCQKTDETHPGWAFQRAESFVSNGPFKLSKWKENGDLELEKNPCYWESRSIKLDKIHLSIIKESHIALDLFLRNRLDWIGDPLSKIPHKSLPSFHQQNRLIDSEQYSLFMLKLNLELLPFKNAKLRKAFALAINRQKLNSQLPNSEHLIALNFTKQPHEEALCDGNIEMARELFEQGLKELNLTKENLPRILFSHSDVEEQELLCRAIGKMWTEAFDIKISFERLPWATYFEGLKRDDYLITGCSWYAYYPSECFFLTLLAQEYNGSPLFQWNNPEYSQLIKEANASHEAALKKELFEKAESIALSELPVIPVLFLHGNYMKNPRLRGVILSHNNQIDFREAYLDTLTKDSHEIKDPDTITLSQK